MPSSPDVEVIVSALRPLEQSTFAQSLVAFYDKATIKHINILFKYHLNIKKQAGTPEYLVVFENIVNKHTDNKLNF